MCLMILIEAAKTDEFKIEEEGYDSQAGSLKVMYPKLVTPTYRGFQPRVSPPSHTAMRIASPPIPFAFDSEICDDDFRGDVRGFHF